MIAFQEKNNGWQIDLTAYGMTFNEFSDYFTKLSQKNYSFPINIELDDELAENLGLIDLENITNYKIRIEGYLVVDNEFFDTYMLIKELEYPKAELSFFYGEDILSVFDKKLNQLPFPIIDATDLGLNAFSQLQLSKEWPLATHNFPRVYRPQLKERENYSDFLGYVNNREGSVFKSNSLDLSGVEPVARNNNVIAPMPYLLEILKVGFATEGRQIRGEFVEDALIRKTVLVPQKFFEYYSDPIQRYYWKFGKTTTQYFIDGKIYNRHKRNRVPTKNGTYIINMKVNIPNGMLSFFDLTVSYGAVQVYRAKATSGTISIEKQLEINVQNYVFSAINIKMETSNIEISLADYNSFTYDYKEGKLNEFPEVYSLTDIMPDMVFRDFYNAIKEFYNLDVTILENAVYLNFLDKSIQRLTYDDHTEYQVKSPKRILSENNLFKLSYPNYEELLINKDGLAYSDEQYAEAEITPLKLSILPVKVIQNEDILTGVHPESDNELLIGIYDGLQGANALLVESAEGKDYKIESVHENYHKHFLSFRANAEIVKEKFEVPVTAPFNLKNGVFKYNKNHLIKNLRKRRLSEGYWQIDVEMESF